MNQSKYIHSIVEKYKQSDSSNNTITSSTPLSISHLVSTDDNNINNDTTDTLHRIPYRECTGSLVYACYTRPDIAYAVGQV